MQKLEVFHPRIRPWLPGCTEQLMDEALLDAAIEFCDATLVVSLQNDPIDLRTGLVEYDVDLNPGTEVSRITAVYIGAQGRPTAFPRYTYLRPSTVVLASPPSTNTPRALHVEYATRPTRTAKSLDDSLFHDWAEGVAAGAVARLALKPSQPFTNEGLAMTELAKFNRAKAQARVESSHRRRVVDTRVLPRPFA